MKKFITAALALSLALCLCACGALDTLMEAANTPINKPAQTLAPAATPAPTPKPEPAATPAPTPAPAPAQSKGISPEFKSAMDSYERFFDEYIEFMNAYAANPGDVSLLLKYADFLTKYSETVEAMESWENRDLNNEELAYYIQVTARIETKLLKSIG